MASPASISLIPRLGVAAAVASVLGLSGCQTWNAQDTVPPTSGVQPLKGLAQNVSVRRNATGMPLIESNSFHDALFTLGYVHASDRITQMVTLRLLAQGRLAEMSGAERLDVDRYMRAVNLKKNADELYKASSPRLKRFFEVYARGVNAYLFRYRDKLPSDLAATGYKPEYWKPEDSALMFCLLNFSQSANLPEEIASLVLAQTVTNDKLAWLNPSYPDEPLPVAEADKLQGLRLNGQIPGLNEISKATSQLAGLNLLSAASSSNWAIAPQRSRSGKSLLASDSHGPLGMPGLWSPVQIRAPKYQAAGVSVAGIPMILAGFNGKVAWSMTSVLGDNQDLFLEKIRRQGNSLSYEVNGKWQPAIVRNETYFIKGQRPIREAVFETRHGPLLNSAQGPAMANGFGLALQTPNLSDDKTLDAFFDLSRAQNVEKASDASREIRAMAVNLVFADASHIGWQVTGRYPNRREGEGLLPSPGWDGRYDWDGYADPMLHPYDQDPAQGWLGTANQRVIPHGYGMQLSNSWAAPERGERMAELAGAGKHDTRSLTAMQYDQGTTFAAKLKKVFEAPGMAQPLKQAIEALPMADRAKAHEAYTRLMAFDGRLSPTSTDAAIYELFLQESMKQIFLDELGPDSSPAWQALVANGQLSYSAQTDHLLGREDSPFWDDVRTPQKEDKAVILARSLAATIGAGESQLGGDHKAWQWGKLHRYAWKNSSGQIVRGPLPAGGDSTTLNTAAFAGGQDFNTTLAPAMRFIVDFGQPEPLMIQDGAGQSGNPVSPNYANGIDPWIKGQYQSLPLQSQNFDRGYGKTRLTLVPGK
ncbi:penicillin acylase family protein [Pseudomonas ogarae]|uniref:penicillin acylase family protein n=1 Tax=Pseudomonas ogarae (strain DSM 112162 / CECT 30235 / F113) TaxID=1114970 RepID=UPI0009A38D50|nr:penicillin acylase family protein [Pseudomonas ogarae]OPG70331.1 penicillin acylase family protein [Pseudomonas ogarae]